MSFSAYLSPIWDRLVGRRPKKAELEERFEAGYRETPLLRRLSRTADTGDAGTSSDGSDTILSARAEGPKGPPGLIASTPAVKPSQGTAIPVEETGQPGAARGVTFEKPVYTETPVAGGQGGLRTRPGPQGLAGASRIGASTRTEREEEVEERRPAVGGGTRGMPIPRARDDHATRAGAAEPGSSTEVREPPPALAKQIPEGGTMPLEVKER
eukprot:GHVT01088370.1.p1 GENE.GHVT01088370.1~~GHVT01088370.1.p1  ORF type:complete len:212 (+),score=18.78 GHVT01088370.1:15-650(+)